MRGLEVDPSLCGQSAARTRVMMIFTGRGRMERVKGIEPLPENAETPQAQALTSGPQEGYAQIRAQISEPTCAELGKVVGAWSRLSQPLKAGILAIVDSALLGNGGGQ